MIKFGPMSEHELRRDQLRLIAENPFEILNLSSMMYDFSPSLSMTLCHDQTIKWANAKVHDCSGSVLCMGRVHQPSEVNARWKEQIQYFQQPNEYAELSGIEMIIRFQALGNWCGR